MRDVLQSARPRRLYGRASASVNEPGTLVVWRTLDPVTGQETEHTRTWHRALPGHRTHCRIDSGKGLRQHRCSTAHAAMVDGYRAWREHEYRAAEAASIGYATEEADYWRTHERPTLKAYLLAMAQGHGDDDTEEIAS